MNQTQMCLEAQRIMGKMCNMEISNSELDIKTSILAIMATEKWVKPKYLETI